MVVNDGHTSEELMLAYPSMWGRSKAARNIAAAIVLILCFFTFFSNLYIRFHYAASMPRSPEPESGRIYPVPAQYGGTVYVSYSEFKRREFVEDNLTWAAILSLTLYGGLGTSLGWWKTEQNLAMSRRK